jgi:hypothetical protein
MLKKVLLIVLGVVLVIAAAAFFYIGPRNVIGVLTYGQQARDGDLQVGDAAPIVDVVALDGENRRPLSDFIGMRPLVLVFGSFT